MASIQETISGHINDPAYIAAQAFTNGWTPDQLAQSAGVSTSDVANYFQQGGINIQTTPSNTVEGGSDYSYVPTTAQAAWGMVNAAPQSYQLDPAHTGLPFNSQENLAVTAINLMGQGMSQDQRVQLAQSFGLPQDLTARIVSGIQNEQTWKNQNATSNRQSMQNFTNTGLALVVGGGLAANAGLLGGSGSLADIAGADTGSTMGLTGDPTDIFGTLPGATTPNIVPGDVYPTGGGTPVIPAPNPNPTDIFGTLPGDKSPNIVPGDTYPTGGGTPAVPLPDPNTVVTPPPKPDPFSDIIKKATDIAGATDWGKVIAGIVGAYGSSNIADAYKATADKYMALGDPSRQRYEASFAPGFTMQNDPGYADAMKSVGNESAAALSMHGNPADSPNAWKQTQLDVYNKVAYPALQGYRQTNASAGGLASFASAVPQADASALNQQQNIWNAGGSIANNLFSPPQTNTFDLQKFAKSMGWA